MPFFVLKLIFPCHPVRNGKLYMIIKNSSEQLRQRPLPSNRNQWNISSHEVGGQFKYQNNQRDRGKRGTHNTRGQQTSSTEQRKQFGPKHLQSCPAKDKICSKCAERGLFCKSLQIHKRKLYARGK